MADVEASAHTPTTPRGRGRGRGRGGRGRGRGEHSNQPFNRHGAGNFGARLSGPASQSQNESTNTSNAKSQQRERRESVGPEDSEVCFICASPITYIGIFQCQHQTCHICALRMRALYKTRACAHCRTESPFVIFTTKDSTERKYEDYGPDDFAQIDNNLGIKYEKDDIFGDTVLLLRYNCPDNDCDTACLSWPDLHRHVKHKHQKVMCDLCTRNKKVFTHEHELFTVAELRKHEKYGDDNPGAVDQSGFLGHPQCGFCNSRWYGDDELYTHCRERHERCVFCDRRSGGGRPQYFRDYAALEKHFEAEHFVCLDAECQANKTNVFESEMDLKAHQLEQHPNGLSKDARRDARLINLSGFDQLRAPYSQPPTRGGRRDREGRGRGRDPNAEPLPQSSAQPQTRAELAFQRQMAIQSSQSVAPRTFGGQLSQLSRSQQPNPPHPPASNPVPQIEELNIDPATMTPQDRARHIRHQAVTSRATALLKNSPAKLDQFRKNVSSFRSGTLTAPDLINSFFALFDCPTSELGKLVRELADLYEDDDKRQSLLSAWSSFRSSQENEDYPSLPGPSTASSQPYGSSGSGTYSGAISSQSSANLAAVLGANVASGRRVLKLKSSTTQSRNAASGNTGRALDTESFPALSTTMSTRTRNAAPIWSGSGQPTTNTKLSVAPAPAPASSASSSRNRAALPPTMSQRQNQELFPSLPKTAKPNLMISGFNTRGSGRLSGNNSGANTPKASAWGASPTPGEAKAALDAIASEQNGFDELTSEPAKGKKGKNKKGQTMNLREYLGS